MRKSIINILAAILLVVSFSSCDDFLTKNNPNEMTTEQFWANLDDCQTGLNAVYNQFRNSGLLELGSNINRSDLSYPGFGRPNATDEYYLQTFNSGSAAPNRQWENLYKGIFRANQVIAGLNGILDEMESESQIERWNNLMGEARFFRGLFHYWTYSAFNEGKIIIFDFVPETIDDFSQPLQKDAQEVRKFFMADLLYAYNKLESKMEQKASSKGKVTKGTAASFIGQSYLYEAEYDSAAYYLRDVIDSGAYSLADPSENSTTHGEFNDESILEISYDLNFKPELDQWNPMGTSNSYGTVFSPVGGWRGVIPSCWLIMAYREDAIDTQHPMNKINYIDENGNELVRNRDFSIRSSYSVSLADDRDLEYYGKTTAQSAPFNNLETAYFRKLTNWDIVGGENELNDRSGVNYRVMRYADVLLMYAECLIQGGQNEGGVEKAISYINEVRGRSYLRLLGTKLTDNDYDEVSYTANSLMEFLMDERALELCLEGFMSRQIDLRRWGITKQRFEDLSKIQYHGEKYETVDEDGEDLVRDRAILRDGSDTIDPNQTLVDYVQAAQNYVESFHAYWPIPTSETNSNPNL